jgi:ABC-type Fe3+ transport system permease subunit
MLNIFAGLVHSMLPFMVIPVWTSLQRLDPAVKQAALSLNASESTVLRRIVLQQVLPCVLPGSLIIFGLSASYFSIPGLLGGSQLKVVETTIYDEFLVYLNWPLGATIAVILLIANLLIMMSYNRVATLKSQGVPAEYAIPKEGSVLYRVGACVVKNSADTEIAQKMVECLLSADAEEKAMEYAYIIPTNTTLKLSPATAKVGDIA